MPPARHGASVAAARCAFVATATAAVLCTVTCASAAAPAAGADAAVTLDGSAIGQRFDGFGALSAGASSRLLWDYPEAQASDILDYLFQPNFGASLSLLKVEIGGDTQSTDGTEPSHMHYRDDLSCTRGYELWLLKEAKKRNPDIVTYGLSWGVPGWVGNGSYFSTDNVNYQTQWLKCMKQEAGVSVDYMGIWNERNWGTPAYVEQLRSAFDAAGFSDTQIVIPDGSANIAGLLNDTATTPKFSDAYSAVGFHYPCDRPNAEVNALGKAFWASEDYSTVADWAGAACWGRSLNQNYIRMNATSTIAWSLIWSVYANLPYYGNGLMYAYEPWSANYTINGPIWTSAHWGQFTKPGWRFLLNSSSPDVPGGAGYLRNGGSYVTLVPPAGSVEAEAGHFSLIIETLEGKCLRCAGQTSTSQTAAFQLAGGLEAPAGALALWSTNETHQFVQQPDISVGSDGSFKLTIEPDSMYTVSTLSNGQSHGVHAPAPPSAPFPNPYTDTFDSYANDTMAKYLSDEGGSFAVFKDSSSGGGVLRQVVVEPPGPNQWIPSPDPLTLVGGAEGQAWTSYNVTIVARVPRGAPGAEPATATATQQGGAMPVGLAPCSPNATPAQAWTFDAPAKGYLENTLFSNQCLNLNGCGADVITYDCVTTGGTCCGAQCYKNLQWTLDQSTGALTSWLNDQCVSVAGDMSLTTESCATGTTSALPSAQKWSYNNATKQLSVELPQDITRGAVRARPGGRTTAGIMGENEGNSAASSMCLTTQPPRSTYVHVCGRIATLTMHGYTGGTCLLVYGSGEWHIRQGGTSGTVVQSGNVTSGFSLADWHSLSLTFTDSAVAAYVDGNKVGISVMLPTTTPGMASLGSGWHIAEFDNLSFQPM